MAHLLQCVRLMPALEAGLAQRHQVCRLFEQADPAAFLAREGDRFEAAVTSAALGLPDAALAALPKLRVISSFGVGTDRLPLAEARARGIAVGFTPDVLNECVADMAFALLLDVARGLSAADRYVRRGDWPRGPAPLGRRVHGARLGVVGMGRIGQAIARRAVGFEMPVRYHSRRARPELPWAHEPSLLALADWADFLVLITPGGPATHHLVNAEVLRALGPQGYLINVARGSVVDEAALVEALTQGHIAGAGLDVFAHEPEVPPALRALDRVVLSPHMASATQQTREAMAQRVLDNLDHFHAEGRVRFSALD